MTVNGNCVIGRFTIFPILCAIFLTLLLIMPYVFAACSYTGNAGLNFYCQICKPPSCSSSTILKTDASPCAYCDGDYISSDGALCSYTNDVSCGNAAQCDFTSDSSCCDEQGNYDWRSFLGTSSTTVSFQCGGGACEGTAYTVSWDTVTFCTPTCAGLGDTRPVAWNIDGEFTECCCCGDDPNEYIVTCQDDDGALCNTLPAGPRWDACCDHFQDCVYDNTCYNRGAEFNGRNCSNGVWRDEVGPIVTVTGWPGGGWTNAAKTAGITCNDIANSCNLGSYRLYTSTTDPGPCDNIDYSLYPLTPPETITEHLWICGAALDVLGNPGYSGPPAPVEFLVDMIQPNTIFNNPPATSWQWVNFNVQLTDADTGGSGVDMSKCEYRVYDTGVGDYVPNANWVSRTCSANAMVTVGAGGCVTNGADTCRVEARTTDIATNVGDTTIRSFSIDTTDPSCSFNSIAQNTNQEYQHVSGTTIWYNTDSGGSFTVYINADDGGVVGSGINRVDFPLTVSGGGSDSSPPSPYEWLYTWDTTDSFDATVTAMCVDNVGHTSTTTFRVDLDTSGPSGGSIDYPNGLWNLSDVSVDFGTVDDSESGINASTASLYRRERPLSGGSCVGAGWTPWGAPIATGPGAAPPNYLDSNIQNAKCYQYKYEIYDKVLNLGSYEQPTYELKVDLIPPDSPATFDNTNFPTEVYDDDGILVFTYTPPSDPESGLDECYMQIDDAVDFATPVFEGWVGSSGSYTWNGGTDTNNYSARVKCMDNAGNLNSSYGTPSNGIVVDTEYPVISLVHDIRDSSDTDDYDTISNLELVGVYWEASDSASEIVSVEYALYEQLLGASIRTVKDWGSAGIVSTATGQMAILNFSEGTLPELLESGKHYYFNVTVEDSVAHTTSEASDGFVVSACEGQPCGKYCNIAAVDGVCNGANQCYLGGKCDLRCSPPMGNRACFENDNDPVNCSDFSLNPTLYCGRFGATRCGDTSLCSDSIIDGACVDPVSGSGTKADITGGWTAYSPPGTGQFYGPNNPLTIGITGISLTVANFQPLLECVFESPVGDYYLDRWGMQDASLTFGNSEENFPLGSDGEWNLTRCSLKTDYDENSGWEISYNDAKYTFKVDTTAPSVWITDPPEGSDAGVKLNVIWDSTDPVSNGISSGVKDYHFQYVDKSIYIAGGPWVDVPLITDNYSIVDLSTKPPGAEFCFRIKARDNANNEGAWSCEPGPPASADFSVCNCTKLNKEAPSSVSVITFPLYTKENPSWFSVNWSAGTKCFEVWFNVTNSTGYPVRPWEQWSEIRPGVPLNDMINVPVAEELPAGGYNYFTVNCTTLPGAVFRPIDVTGEDKENMAYVFRVRAVADGSGYTLISNWTVSDNATVIDRTSPFVNSDGIRNLDGSPIPEGGTIMTGERVTLKVEGDPDKTDFSGVNESWIVYNVTSTGGSIEEGVVPCGGEADKCEVVIGPWSNDYDVSYQGFARDRAGNLGWSALNSFLVRGPLALITTARELYLTLGSYEYVRIDVANRQNVNEEISLSIQPDYPWSKFVDVPGGEFSPDKRIVNITLSPMETKPVMVLVYTADIGSWDMTVYANSTILPQHENITGSVKMKIKVVFPAEFSGLSWPAVFLLFLLAGLAYLRFGTARG